MKWFIQHSVSGRKKKTTKFWFCFSCQKATAHKQHISYRYVSQVQPQTSHRNKKPRKTSPSISLSTLTRSHKSIPKLLQSYSTTSHTVWSHPHNYTSQGDNFFSWSYFCWKLSFCSMLSPPIPAHSHPKFNACSVSPTLWRLDSEKAARSFPSSAEKCSRIPILCKFFQTLAVHYQPLLPHG